VTTDYNLGRFISATNGAYAGAFAEIRAGKKQGHWMWYIFPQLASLGKSDRAKFFGISGLDEAAAFLADASLGSRLIEISRALLVHKNQQSAGDFWRSGHPETAILHDFVCSGRRCGSGFYGCAGRVL
jgi:uncharacterized protein (DUF1810 family)